MSTPCIVSIQNVNSLNTKCFISFQQKNEMFHYTTQNVYNFATRNGMFRYAAQNVNASYSRKSKLTLNVTKCSVI